MDCSPPGSSVQARILEWVARLFSRSSQPRDWTCVSYIALAGGFITTSTTWEALSYCHSAFFAWIYTLGKIAHCHRRGALSLVTGMWPLLSFGWLWLCCPQYESRPSGAKFASVQCKKHLSTIWIVHDRGIICCLSCIKEMDRSLTTEIWDEFLKLWHSLIRTPLVWGVLKTHSSFSWSPIPSLISWVVLSQVFPAPGSLAHAWFHTCCFWYSCLTPHGWGQHCILQKVPE